MTLLSADREANSLAGRLPALSRGQAIACRLLFDARVQRWLRKTWNDSAILVRPATSHDGLTLEVCTPQGTLLLIADTAEWPSLMAAVQLSDPVAVDAVLTALLQPLLAPLQSVCGPTRVRRVLGVSTGPVGTLYGADGWAVRVVECSRELAAHIKPFTVGLARPDLWAIGGLQVRGQLVLMTHKWSTQVLESLECGDVVLPPRGPSGAIRWHLGLGAGPSWPAQVNFKESSVSIESQQQSTMERSGAGEKQTAKPEPARPRTLGAPSGLMATEGPAATWSTLELPVTFELDTARIPLAELATLRPGSAIELDQPLEDAVVRLVCQGQTLGEGQLIAIGERLGVRVTRMGLGNGSNDRS
jgi:type III secretion protein Q